MHSKIQSDWKLGFIATSLISLLLFGCSKEDPVAPSAPPPPPPPQNHVPVITSSPATSVDENEPYRYDITASDADGDQLTFSLVEKPSWLSLMSKTVYGTSPEVQSNQTYAMKIKVSDGKGGDAEQTWQLTVQNLYNVFVLTATQTGQLASVSENNLVFSAPMTFSSGDILAAGVNEKAPKGFLREVTAISSDKKTISTQNSTIEEAIKNGSFSYQQPLSPINAIPEKTVQGLRKTFSPTYAFSYELENVVLEERFGSVVANGSISFNIDYVLEADFDYPKRFLFKIITDEVVDIRLTSTLALYVPSFEKTLVKLNLGVYTFVVPPPLPSIPIVVTPKLEVAVGLDATLTGLFEAHVTQQAQLSPGIKYENGTWGIVKEFSNTFSAPTPTLRTSLDAQANCYVSLDFLLYDDLLPGPMAGLSGGLKLHVASLDDWQLYGELGAFAGVDMGIFSKLIPDYVAQIVSYEKLLLESKTAPPAGEILFTSTRDGNYEIYVMNSDGSGQTRLTTDLGSDWHASWSPDRTKIVFATSRSGTSDEIYTMNADGSNVTRLTNDSYEDSNPKWSPDGTMILFISSRGGYCHLYTMNADGTQQVRRDTSFTDDVLSATWSPNGSKIVIQAYYDRNWEIFTMNSDGSGRTRLTNNSFNDIDPAWSPVGDQIAFSSDRDGHFEIYRMDSNGSNVNKLTDDLVDNMFPSWSPDATYIVYTHDFTLNVADNYQIYLMTSNGTGKTNLTNHPSKNYYPAWAQ
jgi:Tol biopolymer transport system component